MDSVQGSADKCPLRQTITSFSVLRNYRHYYLEASTLNMDSNDEGLNKFKKPDKSTEITCKFSGAYKQTRQ